MTITLRSAVTADEPFLRELYACVRWPELEVTAWSAAQKRAFCDMQYALQDRHYREHFPGAEALVILESGVAIGRIYRCRSERTLDLLDIALVPGARGRGTGTLLLRNLQAEAAREGVDIQLYVEDDNPAQRLYRRLGFVAGELSGVYRMMTWSPPHAASLL